MSYSALTEIGIRPLCPGCGKEMKDGEDIVLVLVTKAVVDPSYNEENDLPVDSLTADFDWSEEIAGHMACFQKSLKWALRE